MPVPDLRSLPTTNDPHFDRAVRAVFGHEGFWSDDPNDPGGPTIWGVSLRYARTVGDLDGDGLLDIDLDGDGAVTAADLRLLRPEQALSLYRRAWWDRYGFGRLPAPFSVKAMDLAVNMGAAQAITLLQRAVRAATSTRLVEDGRLGPMTLAAVQNADAGALLAGFRSEAAGFYRGLIVKNPKAEKYRNGWLSRAYY